MQLIHKPTAEQQLAWFNHEASIQEAEAEANMYMVVLIYRLSGIKKSDLQHSNLCTFNGAQNIAAHYNRQVNNLSPYFAEVKPWDYELFIGV